MMISLLRRGFVSREPHKMTQIFNLEFLFSYSMLSGFLALYLKYHFIVCTWANPKAYFTANIILMKVYLLTTFS